MPGESRSLPCEPGSAVSIKWPGARCNLLFLSAFNHHQWLSKRSIESRRDGISAVRPRGRLRALGELPLPLLLGLPLALPRCPIGIDTEAGYRQTAENQDGTRTPVTLASLTRLR